MFFDDNTLNKAYNYAALLHETTRNISFVGRQAILLGGMSGITLSVSHQESARQNNLPDYSGCDPILFTIAALSELARLAGERTFPPVQLVDLLSHTLPLEESRYPGARILCHGDSTLQLALWFASQGAQVSFSGSTVFLPHLTALGRHEVTELSSISFPENCFHFAVLTSTNNEEMAPFLRKLQKYGSQGAVVMTNWSFLSSTSPRILQLKENLINSCLLTAIQFPSGIIPRMLPAMLQLGPTDKQRTAPIRLINAREWFIPGHQGTQEISYLYPVLWQIFRQPPSEKSPWDPRPPAEDISTEELLKRNCDLRMRTLPSSVNVMEKKTLGNCAALIRGQMLAKRKGNELSHEYAEVVLADIDDFGFVHSASHRVADAPPLPRSRQTAILHPGDILLTCKGSLQSLGKVGLVMENGENWLPSQTFYLIRTECMDPYWLFYYLRSKNAQNYFMAHTSGTSIPQIQVADIASMNIPIPTQQDLKRLHDIHTKALKIKKKLLKLQDDLSAVLQESQKIVSGA